MLFGKLNINKEKLESFFSYLLYGITATLLAIILYSPFLPDNISLKPNEKSPSTIVSPRDLEFESKSDKLINEKFINQIKENISPVYSINQSISAGVIENITSLFDDLISIPKENLGMHVTQILSEDDIIYLKSLPIESIYKLKFNCISKTNSLLSTGLKDINFQYLTEFYKDSLHEFDSTTKELALSIIFHFLEPNLTIDQAQTDLITQQELNSVDKKVTIYKKGHVILYESDIVTNSHIEIFKALNMYNRQADTTLFFGIFLLVSLIFIFLDRYIFFFSNSHYKLKFISLILLILVLIIVIAYICYSITLPSKLHYLFLVPSGIGAMLITALISAKISLISGAVIAILCATMFGLDYQAFLFLFLNNAATCFLIIKSYKRSDFMASGYYLGVFNILFILCIGLLNEQTDYLWFGVNALAGFFNGVVCSMFTLAILPYFEQLFKITTNQTLLELSNLNHPLLKRLMIDAPGTYQHSLMVANLSEAAAEEIGANNVLCRVGSYFHDIGKLKRPIFFSENQFSSENPHDNVSPRMSKMIIISHVKDGLEWAQEYKLPSVLREIIQQHHGTSLLSLFYTQAISKEGVTEPDKEFRYPGPKPQTKESGIIMLADSVEAATRSLKDPSPTKIENIISKVFKSKIDDLQLSDCPLSLREIYAIKSTFLYLFKGIQHKRVDYLKDIKKMDITTKPS